MGMTRIQALVYILTYPDLTALGWADGVDNKLPEEWADLHWANFGQKEGRRYPDDQMLCSLLWWRRIGAPDQITERIVRLLQRWTDEMSGAQLRELADKYGCVDATMIANDRANAQEMDWWNKIREQPWFFRFVNIIPGWHWDGMKWVNQRNDLIASFGTADMYQMAINQGITPGPDVRIKPAANGSVPDPRPDLPEKP